MSEIDLIPDDYRQMLKLRFVLKIFIVSLVLLLVSIGSGKYILNQKVSHLDSSVKEFEQKRHLLEMQQHRMSDLANTQEEMRNHAAVLTSLRNGQGTKQIFQLIDQTFVEGVWFETLSFSQNGQLSELGSNSGSNTDKSDQIQLKNNQGSLQTWKVKKQLSISGHSVNHSTLATLVGQLSSSPEVRDVRVLKTKLSEHHLMEVVSFELAIDINDFHPDKNG